MADIPLLRRGQRPPDNMQRQVPMPRMDPRMFMREFEGMPDQRMFEGIPPHGFEGMADTPNAYTPPGMLPDNTPRGVDPSDRRQLDMIIEQMLAPSYNEGDNVPSKHGLPPGAIEQMLRDAMPPDPSGSANERTETGTDYET